MLVTGVMTNDGIKLDKNKLAQGTQKPNTVECEKHLLFTNTANISDIKTKTNSL